MKPDENVVLNHFPKGNSHALLKSRHGEGRRERINVTVELRSWPSS